MLQRIKSILTAGFHLHIIFDWRKPYHEYAGAGTHEWAGMFPRILCLKSFVNNYPCVTITFNGWTAFWHLHFPSEYARCRLVGYGRLESFKRWANRRINPQYGEW